MREEGFTDDLLMVDLVVKKRLDRVDLLYTSAYTRRDIEVVRDASALVGSVSVDQKFPEAAVLLPAPLVDTTDIKQFTEEFRLASSHEGPFQWVVGGFHANLERDYAQEVHIPGFDVHTLELFSRTDTDTGVTPTADEAMDKLVESRNGFGLDRLYQSQLPYDIEQWALFGEVTHAVTDRLSLTAGARWFDFSEKRRFYSGGFISNQDDQIDKTESDGITPRLLASYTLNDAINLNAQISQGFRLGGVNDPLNLRLCKADTKDAETFGGFPDYDDETLWNYELGLKSQTGATRFNVAVFYTDIEDLQVTLDAGSCSSRVVFNMDEAHTLGVEWEVSAFPAPGLEVGFAGSFAEAEFDSDLRDANGDILGGLEKGNRLPSVPELQLSATATYTWTTGLLGAREMFVSALLQHVGDRYTQPSDQVEGAGVFMSKLPFRGATGDEVTTLDLQLDSYETLNLSFGVRWQSWEAVLYANNATDENARLSFDRERGGRARLGFRTNRPRTVGLTVRTVF